ncbi:MAG: low affinity iron permease family protein [Alloacidobacterium sp.]
MVTDSGVLNEKDHQEGYDRCSCILIARASRNLKLNELIRSTDKARDQMIDIENLSDLELDELHAKYKKIKGEMQSATESSSFRRVGRCQRLRNCFRAWTATYLLCIRL